MRIFFIGTVMFSQRILKRCLANDFEIVGVATKSGSKFNADYADLAGICAAHQIPYKFVKDVNAPHILEWIHSLQPDVVFCFGWSQLIKKELLEMTRLGVIGYHPAHLPKNRGRHPLIWALVLGLEETASTFFFMDEGADSGDILSQKVIRITDQDDAQTLYDKLVQAAVEQVDDFVPQLAEGTYTRIPQADRQANYWRKRGKPDGLIDFRMSSESICNLVRGLTKPYVGAHIEYAGEAYKVWKVEQVDKAYPSNIEPGYVLDVEEEHLIVKTGLRGDAIRVTNHDITFEIRTGMYL